MSTQQRRVSQRGENGRFASQAAAGRATRAAAAAKRAGNRQRPTPPQDGRAGNQEKALPHSAHESLPLVAGIFAERAMTLGAAVQGAVAGIVSGRIAPPRRSTHRSKQLAAVMCDSEPESPLLAIDYRRKNPFLAIRCAGGYLTAGEWAARVRIEGAQVDGSAWSSSVWTSNAEADYLELCCDLPHGGRIERGILLGRADRFALLYDAVVLPSPATIEIENRIELAEGIAFESTRDNTEAVLHRTAKGRASGRSAALARLFPLALPEWREADCAGDLRAEKRHLVWSLGGRGRALFSPIWIDLDRGRSRQRLTWRRLTVGEGLRPVPDEVAVGYRLAVGQKQWLVYRALTARGNRTLLGHNLSTELLAARFGHDGEVDPLIEIE